MKKNVGKNARKSPDETHTCLIQFIFQLFLFMFVCNFFSRANCMTARHKVLFTTDTGDQLSALKKFSFYTFSWNKCNGIGLHEERETRSAVRVPAHWNRVNATVCVCVWVCAGICDYV